MLQAHSSARASRPRAVRNSPPCDRHIPLSHRAFYGAHKAPVNAGVIPLACAATAGSEARARWFSLEGLPSAIGPSMVPGMTDGDRRDARRAIRVGGP